MGIDAMRENRPAEPTAAPGTEAPSRAKVPHAKIPGLKPLEKVTPELGEEGKIYKKGTLEDIAGLESFAVDRSVTPTQVAEPEVPTRRETTPPLPESTPAPQTVSPILLENIPPPTIVESAASQQAQDVVLQEKLVTQEWQFKNLMQRTVLRFVYEGEMREQANRTVQMLRKDFGGVILTNLSGEELALLAGLPSKEMRMQLKVVSEQQERFQQAQAQWGESSWETKSTEQALKRAEANYAELEKQNTDAYNLKKTEIAAQAQEKRQAQLTTAGERGKVEIINFGNTEDPLAQGFAINVSTAALAFANDTARGDMDALREFHLNIDDYVKPGSIGERVLREQGITPADFKRLITENAKFLRNARKTQESQAATQEITGREAIENTGEQVVAYQDNVLAEIAVAQRILQMGKGDTTAPLTSEQQKELADKETKTIDIVRNGFGKYGTAAGTPLVLISTLVFGPAGGATSLAILRITTAAEKARQAHIEAKQKLQLTKLQQRQERQARLTRGQAITKGIRGAAKQLFSGPTEEMIAAIREAEMLGEKNSARAKLVAEFAKVKGSAAAKLLLESAFGWAVRAVWSPERKAMSLETRFRAGLDPDGLGLGYEAVGTSKARYKGDREFCQPTMKNGKIIFQEKRQRAAEILREGREIKTLAELEQVMLLKAEVETRENLGLFAWDVDNQTQQQEKVDQIIRVSDNIINRWKMHATADEKYDFEILEQRIQIAMKDRLLQDIQDDAARESRYVVGKVASTFFQSAVGVLPVAAAVYKLSELMGHHGLLDSLRGSVEELLNRTAFGRALTADEQLLQTPRTHGGGPLIATMDSQGQTTNSSSVVHIPENQKVYLTQFMTDNSHVLQHAENTPLPITEVPLTSNQLSQNIMTSGEVDVVQETVKGHTMTVLQVHDPNYGLLQWQLRSNNSDGLVHVYTLDGHDTGKTLSPNGLTPVDVHEIVASLAAKTDAIHTAHGAVDLQGIVTFDDPNHPQVIKISTTEFQNNSLPNDDIGIVIHTSNSPDGDIVVEGNYHPSTDEVDLDLQQSAVKVLTKHGAMYVSSHEIKQLLRAHKFDIANLKITNDQLQEATLLTKKSINFSGKNPAQTIDVPTIIHVDEQYLRDNTSLLDSLNSDVVPASQIINAAPEYSADFGQVIHTSGEVSQSVITEHGHTVTVLYVNDPNYGSHTFYLRQNLDRSVSVYNNYDFVHGTFENPAKNASGVIVLQADSRAAVDAHTVINSLKAQETISTKHIDNSLGAEVINNDTYIRLNGAYSPINQLGVRVHTPDGDMVLVCNANNGHDLDMTNANGNAVVTVLTKHGEMHITVQAARELVRGREFDYVDVKVNADNSLSGDQITGEFTFAKGKTPVEYVDMQQITFDTQIVRDRGLLEQFNSDTPGIAITPVSPENYPGSLNGVVYGSEDISYSTNHAGQTLLHFHDQYGDHTWYVRRDVSGKLDAYSDSKYANRVAQFDTDGTAPVNAQQVLKALASGNVHTQEGTQILTNHDDIVAAVNPNKEDAYLSLTLDANALHHNASDLLGVRVKTADGYVIMVENSANGFNFHNDGPLIETFTKHGVVWMDPREAQQVLRGNDFQAVDISEDGSQVTFLTKVPINFGGGKPASVIEVATWHITEQDIVNKNLNQGYNSDSVYEQVHVKPAMPPTGTGEIINLPSDATAHGFPAGGHITITGSTDTFAVQDYHDSHHPGVTLLKLVDTSGHRDVVYDLRYSDGHLYYTDGYGITHTVSETDPNKLTVGLVQLGIDPNPTLDGTTITLPSDPHGNGDEYIIMPSGDNQTYNIYEVNATGHRVNDTPIAHGGTFSGTGDQRTFTYIVGDDNTPHPPVKLNNGEFNVTDLKSNGSGKSAIPTPGPSPTPPPGHPTPTPPPGSSPTVTSGNSDIQLLLSQYQHQPGQAVAINNSQAVDLSGGYYQAGYRLKLGADGLYEVINHNNNTIVFQDLHVSNNELYYTDASSHLTYKIPLAPHKVLVNAHTRYQGTDTVYAFDLTQQDTKPDPEFVGKSINIPDGYEVVVTHDNAGYHYNIFDSSGNQITQNGEYKSGNLIFYDAAGNPVAIQAEHNNYILTQSEITNLVETEQNVNSDIMLERFSIASAAISAATSVTAAALIKKHPGWAKFLGSIGIITEAFTVGTGYTLLTTGTGVIPLVQEMGPLAASSSIFMASAAVGLARLRGRGQTSSNNQGQQGQPVQPVVVPAGTPPPPGPSDPGQAQQQNNNQGQNPPLPDPGGNGQNGSSNGGQQAGRGGPAATPTPLRQRGGTGVSPVATTPPSPAQQTVYPAGGQPQTRPALPWQQPGRSANRFGGPPTGNALHFGTPQPSQQSQPTFQPPIRPLPGGTQQPSTPGAGQRTGSLNSGTLPTRGFPFPEDQDLNQP